MRHRAIALLLAAAAAASPALAQYEPERDGWNFYNFLTTEDAGKLWGIYSKAFLGVAESREAASPEDALFFDEVIMRYAGHASCFGMSLLSLVCYREGGHLGVCGPVGDYEGDLADGGGGPDLEIVRESIGIMHLRQLTQPMISALIDLFNDHEWSDPVFAYNRIQTAIASGDLPLLSFMPSSIEAIEAMGAGAEAHTIVPYRCEDAGTRYRIYVWDPNFPFETESVFYVGPTPRNYIDIEKTSTTHPWKYPPDYAPGGYGWQGSSAGPWTFIATSVSQAKYKGNHPLSAGYITGEIGTLIFSGGGSAAQIEDEEGRRFYKAAPGGRDLERDLSKKTNNVVRWPFFHGKRPSPELYFIRGIGGKSYDIEVEAEGSGYSCELLLPGSAVSLELGAAAAGKDAVKLRAIGSARQEIELSSSRELRDVALEIRRALPEGKGTRTFKITELELGRGSPVSFRLDARQEELEVANPAGAIRYSVELSETVAGKTKKLPARRMESPAGAAQKVRPSAWKNLDKSTLDVKTIERPASAPKRR
ncbi:MAG: hypothetical protein C4574_07120 [Candidatus Latescibacterota bacterium]|nr:MAG: hypothetical protein C4574_07120 [Candidatus Latescibacterota bacterium]